MLKFLTGLLIGATITVVYLDWVNPPPTIVHNYFFEIDRGIIVKNGETVEFNLEGRGGALDSSTREVVTVR